MSSQVVERKKEFIEGAALLGISTLLGIMGMIGNGKLAEHRYDPDMASSSFFAPSSKAEAVAVAKNEGMALGQTGGVILAIWLLAKFQRRED